MVQTVNATIRQSWAGGFVADVTVAAGATALDGWTVTFDAPFALANLWNARIISHEGSRYVIGNLDYNGAVAANGVAGFGFQAAGEPGQFSLIPATVAPPRFSIADAAIAEPLAGTAALSLTVRLDQSSATAVTVDYATVDGTAVAGRDYTATAGSLTFAPGETSRTIAVPILSDNLAEGAERFSLQLGQAGPAATVTIRDAAAPGHLATSGNQIVNAAGTPVQINAVNWFGGETTTYVPHGLWTRDYHAMLDQMVQLGFNTVRLPYSDEALVPGRMPDGIDYALNPDLRGLNVLEVYDRIIDHAGQVGLRIIFDHHRTEAGDGPNSNGLWYSATTPEARVIQNWQLLADRYGANPTVIGADLANEPYRASWGDGSATDWRLGAERMGNAILERAPGWLIIVEGTGEYRGDHYWWGGNLEGVRDAPVRLAVADRLVYSPHDYPHSVYPQPWFNAADYPNNMDEVFRKHWGYIFEEGIAPILLGEWGSRIVDPKDQGWLDAMTRYLSGDFDQDGDRDLAAGQLGMSWAWWAWNPNSGDTGGILRDDWISVDQRKVDVLKAIMSGPINAASPVAAPGNPGMASFVTSGALAAGSVAPGVTAIDLTGDNLGADSLDHLRGLTSIKLSASMTPLSATFSAADADAFQGRIINVSAPNTQLLGVDGRALGADSSLRATATHDIVALGGAGDDVFTAGDGSSTMQGGAGDDRFVFASLAALEVAQVDGGVDHDTLEVGAAISHLTPAALLGKMALEAVVMVAAGPVTATLGPAAAGAFNGQITLSAPYASGVAFDATAVAYGSVVLYGTAGRDTLLGGAGDDWLVGQGGADIMRGGAGQDMLVVQDAAAVARLGEADGGIGFDALQITTGQSIADTAFATLRGLEHLQLAGGGAQAAQLGEMAAAGFGGHVTITAPGATSLFVDAATMSTGVVEVYATAGADTLRGGAGADIFRGLGAGDVARGGGGDDTFCFATVADLLACSGIEGGAGYDIAWVQGGGTLRDVGFAALSGVEHMIFDLGPAALVGPGAGRVSVTVGQAAARAFTGDVAIQVSGGALSLDASGLAGKGVVAMGGDGDDIFVGSAQNDVFIGGAGRDAFIFGAQGGTDRIEGWHAGDRLFMQAMGESQVAAMLASASEQGGYTQLAYGAGNAIFLGGVPQGGLTMGDFIWGL